MIEQSKTLVLVIRKIAETVKELDLEIGKPLLTNL